MFIELDMVKACDRVGSGPDSWIGWLSPGVIEKSMYQYSPFEVIVNRTPHGSFSSSRSNPVLFHYTGGSSG